MTLEAPLEDLARDVARADAAWRAFHARLARDPESAKGEDPLASFRRVSRHPTFESLRAASPPLVDVPLRDALLSWVQVLIERRVTLDLHIGSAVAAEDASAEIAIDAPQKVSFRKAWRELALATDRRSALAWLGAAADRGPALAAFAREEAARRGEVARRLGLSFPFALATSAPREALALFARTFLRDTADVATAVRRERLGKSAPHSLAPTPIDALLDAAARDASEGWPARLTRRWLEETFPALTRGLTLDLALPRVVVGASSFVRALAAFGYAFRSAGSSRILPFPLARDPRSVDAHRFALVFACLPTEPTFHLRALSTSARIAAREARSVSYVALVEARAIAVRALLGDEHAFADAFEERTTALWGAPLPATLAGAWPLLESPPSYSTGRDSARDVGSDRWARLLALATALPVFDGLTRDFDDDWFQNPRAIQELRSRASAPAHPIHQVSAGSARFRLRRSFASAHAALRAGPRLKLPPLALLLAFASSLASAAAPTGPHLPLLASVPRVRLELHRDRVLVLEDVNLSRGDWQGGNLDLYVAFGAPGVPYAIDARLSAWHADTSSEASGATDDPSKENVGEAVTVEAASHRPASAFLLLGPPEMAGVVVHVREAAFRRAASGGQGARLRLRSLLDRPPEDAHTGREVVVRLGTIGTEPLALGAIEIASLDPQTALTRAEAHLCGPVADPYPLAIAVLPTPLRRASFPGPVAPALAARHASDSLCVRFW